MSKIHLAKGDTLAKPTVYAACGKWFAKGSPLYVPFKGDGKKITCLACRRTHYYGRAW